ncbi:unnamed protein product [Musa hybrid cultivar]
MWPLDRIVSSVDSCICDIIANICFLQISGHAVWIAENTSSSNLTQASYIIEFQKCHADHPIGKFFRQCTELKIKLDRCFRQEVFENMRTVKRKANFEENKKFKERLQAYRKEMAEKGT